MTDVMKLDGEDWDESMFEDVFGDTAEYVKLVVFLVDSSGSMEGTIIGSVNSIMEEVLSELERDKGHKRLVVIEFGEEVTWMNSNPKTVEEFGSWKRIHGGTLSNMGEALKQLSEKLKDPNWCPKGRKGVSGRFILFSDGLATDRYEEGMELLKSQEVFQKGERLAVNLSDKMDKSVLEDFTGKTENVLCIKSSEIGKAEKKILSVITN